MTSESREAPNAATDTNALAFNPVGSTDPEPNPEISKMAPDLDKDGLPLPPPIKPFWEQVIVDVEYENVASEQRRNIRGCLELVDFYNIIDDRCKDRGDSELFIDMLHNLAFEDLFTFVGSQDVMRDPAATFDGWRISRRGTRIILVHGSSRVTLNHRKAETQIKNFVHALPDGTKQFQMLVFSPLLKTTLGRVIDETTGRAIGSPIFPTRDAAYSMAYGPRGGYSPPVDLPTISEVAESKPAASSPVLRPFATRKVSVSTVSPEEAAQDDSLRPVQHTDSVDYIADLLGLEPVLSGPAAAPVAAGASAPVAAPIAAPAPSASTAPAPAPAVDPVIAPSPVPAPAPGLAPVPSPAPSLSTPTLYPGVAARHPAFQNVRYTHQGFQTAASAFTSAPVPNPGVPDNVQSGAPRRTIVGGVLQRDIRATDDQSDAPPPRDPGAPSGNTRGYGYATFNPDYSVNESGGNGGTAGYYRINIPHGIDPPVRYSSYIFIPEGVTYVMRTAWNPGNTNKLSLPSFYPEDNGDNWYESTTNYFLCNGIYVPPFATLQYNNVMGTYWDVLVADLPGVVAHQPQWSAAIYSLLMSALDDKPSRITNPVPGPTKIREILMESCGDGYLALYKIMQYHAAQLNHVLTTRIKRTNIPVFGTSRSIEEYTGRFRQHCRQRYYTSGQLYFAPEFQLLYLRQLPSMLTRVFRNLYWEARLHDWPDSYWTVDHIPRPLLFAHIVEHIENACTVNELDVRQIITTSRQSRGRGTTAQAHATTFDSPTPSLDPDVSDLPSFDGVVNMAMEDGQVHAMMVSGPSSPCVHCGKTWVHKLGDCPGLVRAITALHITKRYPEVDTHILQKYAGSTKILSDNRVTPATRADKPPASKGPARAHAAAASSDAPTTEPAPSPVPAENQMGACEMLTTDIYGGAYSAHFSADVCGLGAVSVPELHGYDLMDEFPVDPPVPSLVPEVLPYLQYLDAPCAASDDDSTGTVHHVGAAAPAPWFSSVDRSRYVHVDDGANVSVVMHAGLLHDFRVFEPVHCPSLYDVGGNAYVCTGSGFLRIYSASLGAHVYAPAFYSPTIKTNIFSPKHLIESLGNGLTGISKDHRRDHGTVRFYDMPGVAEFSISGRLHVGLLWVGPLLIPDPLELQSTARQPWGTTVTARPRWPKGSHGSYVPIEMGESTELTAKLVDQERQCRSLRRQTAQHLARVLSLLNDAPDAPACMGIDCLQLPALPLSLDISDCSPASDHHPAPLPLSVPPSPCVHAVQTRSQRSLPRLACPRDPVPLRGPIPDAPPPDVPRPIVTVPLIDGSIPPSAPVDAVVLHSPSDTVPIHDDSRRRLLRTLYHQRLGHLGFRRLSSLHKAVDGIPSGLPDRDPIGACPVCLSNKLQRVPTRATSPFVATQPYEGLSMDFGFIVQRPDRGKMGPADQLFSSALRQEPESILSPDEFRQLAPAQKYVYQVGLNGETAYLIIRDHYSGGIFGTAVTSKVPPIDFLRAFLERHRCNSSNKVVRLDQGGDLGGSRRIRELLASFGYQVQLTAPDTPQQNGFIERVNQDVGKYLRTALNGSGLPPRYWPFAFHMFLRIHNYVPHDRGPSVPKELQEKTPYEILTGRRPNLSHLRTFGCRVWVLPPGGRTRKSLHNTRAGRFLGYKITTQNILYLDEATKEIREAHHAKFDEAFNDVAHPPPNAVALRVSGSSTPETPLNLPDVEISPLQLDVLLDPSLAPLTISVTPTCTHEHLGFEIAHDDRRDRAFIRSIVPNTSASRIRLGRQRFIGAYVLRIDGKYVQHRTDVLQALRVLSQRAPRSPFDIVLDPEPYVPPPQVPQSPAHLSYDQMASIHSIRTARTNDELDSAIVAFTNFFDDACMSGLVHSLGTVTLGTAEERALPRLTRNRLRKLATWEDWQRGPKGEFAQLDEMHRQGMYGDPIAPPANAIVLRPHWTYSFKADGTRKARNCCDGSKRAAPMLHGAAKTYASCVEQPCMRMFFALCAVSGMSLYGADATNAFANSPPPSVPTYVMIDDAYWDWYKERFDKELDRHHVLPVQHALQGHPESGSLWEQLINELLLRIGLQNTTHERNLYHGVINGDRILICRQVDDLAIGCENVATYDYVLNYLMGHVALTKEGLLRRFNGVDIDQTQHYVRIHCQSYIDRFLAAHGWDTESDDPTKPFEPLLGTMLEELQTSVGPPEGTQDHAALQEKFQFSYRGVLGEMIYAFVVARLDIGFAVVHLSKYSSMPAAVHYTALIRVAKYLRRTKDWGLVYWRQRPVMSLPPGTLVPFVDPSQRDLPAFPKYTDGQQLVAYADAAHGTDLFQRRSVSGVCCVLGGAAIVFKSKQQDVIATSSTEAEFVCAVHTGKIVKYLRSILHELGFTQSSPTPIYEDNQAAIAMVNNTKPTTRSRHIDIQHFAIQEWKRRGILFLEHIQGILSPSDALTKPLGWMLHQRHCRRLMGHFGPPAYCTFSYPPAAS
jgi:transposase InsO family protein